MQVVDAALKRDGEVDQIGLAFAEQNRLAGLEPPYPDDDEQGRQQRQHGDNGCADRDPGGGRTGDVHAARRRR
jgi:hypothetical protein